ncbi:MAG: hypothetical protein AMJ42_06000, partial [Deltaproteobacteria bacterium DG_8]
MDRRETSFSFIPSYKLAFYNLSKLVLVISATYLYFLCFHWNTFFAILMLPLFAYIVYGVSSIVVNFLIYLSTKPLLLKEREDVLKKGIPDNVKIIFFRPVFAKSVEEMETLIESMKRDIQNNQEGNRNIKFIVIDNTRDETVKQKTRKMIKDLEAQFGEDVVFYFHRNPKSDFFKKLGIYQDAIMLLYEGWTKPKTYVGKEWEKWTKGTRNPEQPIFDEIIGDISGLGIEGSKEDIINGREVAIREGERPEIAIVCDADNVWPKGSIRKIAVKLLHPENRDIVIYQPSIEVSNPNENGYIRLNVLAREMIKFDPIARWRMYHFSPFYGKGAMQIEGYVRDVVKTEAIHPGKAASHDFQESLRAWTALVEDIYIYEKTFSNKLSELTRSAQWGWGDMETVGQFIFEKFEPGRRSHLYALVRLLVGNFTFSLWLVGTSVSWMVPGLATMSKPRLFFSLIGGILILSILIPKFMAPMANRFKRKTYEVEIPQVEKNIFTILREGIFATVVSFLIHLLDLVYKPRALIKNLINQARGRPFVWKTGAMGEIETANV